MKREHRTEIQRLARRRNQQTEALCATIYRLAESVNVAVAAGATRKECAKLVGLTPRQVSDMIHDDVGPVV